MRAIAMCALLAAASGGCLRSAEFRCLRDSECGADGVCEPVGYCSVPNAACTGTGRSFSDSAGQNLSNACVPGDNPGPGPGVDGGVGGDAATDAPIDVGCPPDYAPVAGSGHVYKARGSLSWDEAASQCRGAAAAAYLAVPDDATELANLATLVSGPFWIGVDDKAHEGTFVTQRNAAATFLPWAEDEPDNGPPAEDCVDAVSATEIATERCGSRRVAVCECEP